jgi:hypothetical protein
LVIGALLFGVAVSSIYVIGSGLASSAWFMALIFDAGVILSLWIIPYFITKRVMSDSNARKLEAGALGVFLIIMGCSITPLMVGWHKLFSGLLFPNIYFLLFIIALAFLVAYKRTKSVPLTEISIRQPIKPIDKIISSWVILLVILAFLLFWGSISVAFPSSDSNWGAGLVLLLIILFFLFACGVILIVQYAMKSPKAALVIAILINILLIVFYFTKFYRRLI